ncbi:MAG: phosphopantetheine-binding protein [Syntrophales bacterium]|nr:phosphopantetheine-binding protein [Syntrophales bacterium]
MNIFAEIEKILAELLDLEDSDITPDTYLIKDLGAESIDLLELAVAINNRFKIPVKDDDIFLGCFRHYMSEAEQQMADTVPYIAEKYPFLTKDRIKEIAARTVEGPQLKIRDLVDYVTYQLERARHAGNDDS